MYTFSFTSSRHLSYRFAMMAYKGESNGRQMNQQGKPSYFSLSHFLFSFYFSPVCCSSLHDNKPVYRLLRQSIRRLAFVPPYSVFCSIRFRCGGLSIERNQKPLTPENPLAVTHYDKQKQVEVKRSSRANPHEIRLFSGCPYCVSCPIWIQVNRAAKFMDFVIKMPSKWSNSASHYVNERMRNAILFDMFAASF